MAAGSGSDVMFHPRRSRQERLARCQRPLGNVRESPATAGGGAECIVGDAPDAASGYTAQLWNARHVTPAAANKQTAPTNARKQSLLSSLAISTVSFMYISE